MHTVELLKAKEGNRPQLEQLDSPERAKEGALHWLITHFPETQATLHLIS